MMPAPRFNGVSTPRKLALPLESKRRNMTPLYPARQIYNGFEKSFFTFRKHCRQTARGRRFHETATEKERRVRVHRPPGKLLPFGRGWQRSRAGFACSAPLEERLARHMMRENIGTPAYLFNELRLRTSPHSWRLGTLTKLENLPRDGSHSVCSDVRSPQSHAVRPEGFCEALLLGMCWATLSAFASTRAPSFRLQFRFAKTQSQFVQDFAD